MNQLIKLTFVLALVAGCSSDKKAAGTPDAAPIQEIDAAPVGPDCFTGTPTTHDELINSCPAADVTRIIKKPNLPLLNADGSLPPLP